MASKTPLEESLESMMSSAGIPMSDRAKMMGLVSSRGAPEIWLRELIHFCCAARTGTLPNISPVEKKRLLEAATNRGCQRIEKVKQSVMECLLGKDDEAVGKVLLQLVLKERSPTIRQIIWGYLLSKSEETGSIIDLEQVVPLLWEKDALLRNTAVNYLARHYSIDCVLEVITVIQGQKDSPLSVVVLQRLLERVSPRVHRFFIIKMTRLMTANSRHG